MTTTYIAAGTPNIVGVAKTRLFIGDRATFPASVNTWTELGTCLSLPIVGPSDAKITVDTIGNSLQLKLKGVTDPGGGALSLAEDFGDAGGIAIKAAQADKTSDYPFLYILPNAVTTTGTGTQIVVMGKVLKFQTDFGSGPNNPVKATVDLEYTTLATYTAAS
jgi:hypothetical protein